MRFQNSIRPIKPTVCLISWLAAELLADPRIGIQNSIDSLPTMQVMSRHRSAQRLRITHRPKHIGVALPELGSCSARIARTHIFRQHFGSQDIAEAFADMSLTTNREGLWINLRRD